MEIIDITGIVEISAYVHLLCEKLDSGEVKATDEELLQIAEHLLNYGRSNPLSKPVMFDLILMLANRCEKGREALKKHTH